MQACVADLIYYFIPENNKLKYEKYKQSEGTVKISDKHTIKFSPPCFVTPDKFILLVVWAKKLNEQAIEYTHRYSNITKGTYVPHDF